MAIDLDATLLLPLASRYQFPDDAAQLLPRSYGDFLSPEVIHPDAEDGGFLPAVLIDRTNWVFCLNDWPIPASPAPRIFASDTEQELPVYTFYPAIDYESLGKPIAAVQFNTDPGTRAISWRGYGTAGTDGLLIDNPLLALYDAFAAYGGWTLDDFDLATSFATFRTLQALGAQMRWSFWAQRTYREWLTEILRCYLTNFWETSAGKLAMVLDRGILGLPVPVLNTIDAAIDLEGTEDDVEYEVDESNIVNTLTVKRRLKWTTNQYTEEPTVDHRPSVGLYGPLRDEVELPALYTDVHGQIWVQAYFARYGYLPAVIRFSVRGLGYATALPGTYLGFLWSIPGWTDQARLVMVLNQEVDPFGMRISFEVFDCGRFVTDDLTLPDVLLPEVRRRIRVPDQSLDLTPPGPASNLSYVGSYRQIVLRWTAPGDLDYDHTEIWASGNVNNRANAVLVRNGGQGVPPGGACEETFAVEDGSFYFVWLMTVDKSGNGRNGDGNWYPSNPTAGIAAAPVLVNTPGIAPAAVTDVYGTAISAVPRAYINEQIMAQTQIGANAPQEGTFILKGGVRLTIPPLCTAFLQIKRGGINGGVVGTSPPVVNITNGQVTIYPDCWGGDTTPAYLAAYVLTAQVLSQAPAQVSYTVLEAYLSLWQPKR
jgi:hypothetical protein